MEMLMNIKLKMQKGIKSPYKLYLIFPALLIYTVLRMFPAAAGLFLSFFNLRSFDLSSLTFAGLSNYTNILNNPYMNVAIKNTLIFAIVTTIGKTVIGLALALFVNRKFRGVNYMRTVFFLPAVLNNVAVGLVFRSMMHPTGLINQFLTAIGLEVLTQNWSGYSMIVFLAGLQAVDQTYYESAEIDGASWWERLSMITLPLIMPAFKNALVINIVGGLKVFDLVQTITKGGPGSATSVFGTLIYSSFSKGNYGAGCAASIILTIFVLAIALPTNKYISGKEVEV